MIHHDCDGSHFAEVSRMVFVEENTVVMQPASITAATRVLTMLADPPMPCTHMPALLAILAMS